MSSKGRNKLFSLLVFAQSKWSVLHPVLKRKILPRYLLFCCSAYLYNNIFHLVQSLFRTMLNFHLSAVLKVKVSAKRNDAKFHFYAPHDFKSNLLSLSKLSNKTFPSSVISVSLHCILKNTRWNLFVL